MWAKKLWDGYGRSPGKNNLYLSKTHLSYYLACVFGVVEIKYHKILYFRFNLTYLMNSVRVMNHKLTRPWMVMGLTSTLILMYSTQYIIRYYQLIILLSVINNKYDVGERNLFRIYFYTYFIDLLGPWLTTRSAISFHPTTPTTYRS